MAAWRQPRLISCPPDSAAEVVPTPCSSSAVTRRARCATAIVCRPLHRACAKTVRAWAAPTLAPLQKQHLTISTTITAPLPNSNEPGSVIGIGKASRCKRLPCASVSKKCISQRTNNTSVAIVILWICPQFQLAGYILAWRPGSAHLCSCTCRAQPALSA